MLVKNNLVFTKLTKREFNFIELVKTLEEKSKNDKEHYSNTLESAIAIVKFNYSSFKHPQEVMTSIKLYLEKVLYFLIICDKEIISENISYFLWEKMFLSEFNEFEKEYWFTIIMDLLITSCNNRNFILIKEFKKSISSFFYGSSEKNTYAKMIASFVVMYCYYLSSSNEKIDKNTKNYLLDIIKKEEVSDRIHCNSIIESYRRIINKFDVPLHIYIKFFKFIPEWDLIVYNTVYSVVVDDSFAINWYFSNFLASYSLNYSLMMDSNENKEIIEKLIGINMLQEEDVSLIEYTLKKHLYENSKKDTIFDMLAFLNARSYINTHKYLEKIVSDLSKKSISSMCIEYTDEAFNAMIGKIKDEANTLIENIPFYDGKVDEDYLPYSFSFDLFSENLEKYIYDTVQDAIDSFISFITPKFIEINENNTDLINEDVTYYSSRLNFYLDNYSDDVVISALKSKIVESSKSIETHYLYDSFFTTTNPKLRCVLYDVKIRYFSEKELLIKLEQYRREDSKYCFNGYIATRDEILETIKNYWVKITYNFRFTYDYEPSKMFSLNI